jgi:PIN domain nuclease of toxin-antitoxin system
MRVLLDTHTFLWAITEEFRLSPTVRSLMANGECCFSVASIWEVIVKARTKKISLPEPVGPFLTSELAASRVRILPITLNHVLRIESLHLHHRDPFDRMLVAQGLEEDIPVLTADPLFKKYPVRVIW